MGSETTCAEILKESMQCEGCREGSLEQDLIKKAGTVLKNCQNFSVTQDEFLWLLSTLYFLSSSDKENDHILSSISKCFQISLTTVMKGKMY